MGKLARLGLAAVACVAPCLIAACGGDSHEGDPNLESLQVSAGELSPAFSPYLVAYDVYSVVASSVTVTATTTGTGSTMTVNGVPTGSGSPSQPIALTVGATTVTIVVRSADGTNVKTYLVTFHRVDPAALKPSDVGVDEAFGISVAISGDAMVVGAPHEDGDAGPGDEGAPDAGAAYVFVRSGTVWTQQARLVASNADAGDRFGWSVAISGDTLVVGACGHDGDGSVPADDGAGDSGAAYVFVRSGTTWTERAYLTAPSAERWASFGAHVAISGDTILVGAADPGATCRFVRLGTTWTRSADGTAGDAERGDVVEVGDAP